MWKKKDNWMARTEYKEIQNFLLPAAHSVRCEWIIMKLMSNWHDQRGLFFCKIKWKHLKMSFLALAYFTLFHDISHHFLTGKIFK